MIFKQNRFNAGMLNIKCEMGQPLLRSIAILALVLGIAIADSAVNAQCILLNDDFSSAPPLAASNTDGAWYPDRYPPSAFTSDAGRLKISISAADGAQLRPGGYSSSFYNTQGRKFNQCGKCVTVLKGDLYIPSDWATNHRRSDMWATAYDISNAISFYPVIGFRNVTGANPQMSYWDGAAWVELGAPSNGYDTWYALEIRLNGANLEYLIDNAVVGTLSSGGSVYFGDIIMQAYNFNDNTLTDGAYDPGPDNSYDAFWDNLVTTGTGGNLVTNLNTGETFCKIQAAIDAPLTLAGHTIEAGPGAYNENVLINKDDLTIRSTGGKGVTTIQGTLAGGNYGTVAIASGTNGVTLGQSGKGFTIIGFDGTGGIEAAAVYLLGAHTDIAIEGNEIRADGDHGLLANYNAAIDGITVNDNMFTGKTFLGAEPGGCGFATQFDPGNNVPRQLVTMGGGAGVTASKNVTFTNNMVTGTTGGYNSTDGCEQGNQLVTIDVIGAEIRNNIFNGTTTRGAYSLRTRGKLTSIGCNTFHSDFLSATCAHIFFGSPAPLTGASPSTLAGIASVNAFPDGGAFLTPDHPSSWLIFKDMAQAVAAAGLIGAGQAPVPAAPAFTCPVTNTNTGNVFCSIQDAIEASMTLSGHLLAVPACSYTEFVDAVAPGKDITLAPGASPGCVTITGGLTLGSGDALDMEINGTSACTDYDRFSVNGAVTLGGATLTPTLGYSPSPGDSYTLIANDGADAVSGQFAEGTNISVGTDVFTINYAGGDGNDVVLTYCGTGKVQNTTTSEWFCTIQAAIDEAQTLNGHTLSVNAGTFNENVTVSKELTINGAGNGSSPATNTVLTPAVSCTGTGITVSAANVTLNNMYVTDYQDAVALGGISAPALTDMALIDYCRYGVRLDGNNSSVSITGTDIQRTTFLAATVGIRAGTANAVNGMTIDDCTINGNVQGMAIFQSSTPVAFDDITIKNSTISNNTQKGLYFEKLSNALLENLTMDNNGTDAAYGFNNGIDINLKYDDYSSITIKDCDITNSGATGTAADLENPAAIAIKARDDASSYNTIPATLTGVTIKNNKITGPRNGIRFGEFGKINNTPSNVTIEGNDLSYAFSNKTIVLRTNNDVNLVCNWHGSTDLPTILATLTEAGSGSFMLSSVLGSGGDSSPDAGFQPSGSCSCPSGNLVTNTNTSETFCTIQGAIDDPDTQNGHTLSVSAGTYIENVIVDKSLTINGPNAAINPCSGTRVAEAIVVPAVAAISSGEIFHVAASNVTISGFTIDGDNPSLASGFTSTNGADIDAAEGVTVYETGINNLTVTNNILQNLSYFGVTLYDYPAGVPSSGHSISNNRFTDFGTYDAGSGIDYWGGGVLLYNNQYAHVSNNCMTNVRSGVQTGNFYLPNPGAATYQVIENNTIQARRRGIFHNLFYSSASPYTLDDNAITALDHISESYWDGILISSHQGVASTTSDNVIDGSAVTGKPTEGIEVWNVRNTAPALISGGSVTGVSIGLFVNNYEGYVSDAGEGAHATVSGLTVTDCPLGAKIFDSPSSTLHAAVNATIQDDCHFSHSSGGTTGILVSGAAASATIQNNDASFHGFTTGIDVDAGSATIDNNHIYDNTTGIRFTDGGSGSVTNNDFDGATDNGTDLRLDSDAGTVSADGGNAFAGDTYGVDNQSAAVVDAENNYWDAPDGPGPYPIAFGSGVNITTNVDYCPYLDAPGGMPLPATACSCGFTCASPITFTGNVTLSTQSQVNTFLNGSGCKYTHITGNLVIDGNGNAATGADADGIDPITDLCNLQELVSIGGSLTIRDFKVAGNPTTLADLANLQTIGTSLTIGATNTNDGNSSFTAIQLNGITDVGDAGAITIRFNTNAVDIELPNLAGQVGATTVSDNGAVDNIDIGSQGAGWNTAGTNSVVVQNNGTLNSVDFSKLTSTGGDVTVSNNNSADLSDINLAQLVTVGDAFTLDNNNANLTGAAIALDALTTVGGDGAGDMNINDIATGTLDLSALVTVNGNMSISNNDGGLVAIELLQLNLVGIGNHTLSITGNNNLTTITDGLAGPAITVTRDVTISTNPNLQTVDLADLTTVTRDVSISGNDSPSLATVNLPALTSVGRNLTIDNDNTATSGAVVSMPLLTTVGTSLTGNMNVSQVASSLTAGSSLVVEGNLTVDDNNPMCALDLSGLTQVKGFVLISDNFENCTSSSIDISNLATVGDNLPAATSDYLTIEGNNDMSALSLTSLTAVNGTGAGNSRSIEIVSNTDMMTSLSMPALITVPGEIYIQNNTNLAGISAPLLPTVGEDLRIVTNPALTSIAFGALTGVTGAFEINNNDALPDLNGFGVLATIGGAATITGNGNSFPGSGSDLTSLDGLASLTTIGGALTVTNNPMLGTCCIIPCGLVSVNSSPDPFTGNLTISGNLSFANGGRCIANGPTAAIEVARTACTVTISSFTSSDNSGIVADDDIICFGDDIDFEVMASATSGTLNYLFFEDVDNSGDFSVGDVTIQNGTSNTCTASGLSAGAHNINIQVSNGGGCEVYSLTIVVTVYTLPSAGITVSNGSVCTGDEITLDGNPVAGTATLTTPVHTWSVTGGSGSGSFNPGTADVNPIGFIGATAGTVDLAYTVTDDYGCVSDPATLTISALPGGMACPGPITYTGNITLDSQTDLNAFIGPGGCKYTHVTGNLTLVGNTGSDPIVNLCNLTELQSVGGAFAIRDFNSPLNPTGLAELSNLANVTGSLTVGGAAGDANTQFNSIISLPALTTVGGTLNMSYNAGVTGLAVNALTSVGTDININNSAGLLSINIGAATVVRDFLIQGNNATALASITAGVTSVGRNLTFDNNNTGAGTTITMAGLTNVTGNCNISEIAAGTLTLPVLATVGGTATFSNNDDGLAGIALPALVSIGNLGGVTGDLSITNNNSLASISTLGSNFTVGRDLAVTGNHDGTTSSLATVDFTGLTQVGRDINLDNDNRTSGGATVNFSNLANVGDDMTISQIAAAITATTALAIVSDLTVSDNNNLCDANLSGLQTTGGFLSFTDNYDLCVSQSIDFTNLQTVGAYLIFTGNDDMPSLVFTDLTAVNGANGSGRSVDITNNDLEMTAVMMPALNTGTTGEFRINGNAALLTVNVPLLPSVGEDLRLEDNNAVSTLNFSALSAVTGLINIDDEDAVTDLGGFAALVTVNGLTINGNNALQTVSSMTGVTTMSGSLNISNNPALNGISGLANLVTINGNFTFNNNDATVTLDGAGGFNSLDYVDGTAAATGNALLANCCVMPCRVEDPMNPGFTDGGGAINVGSNNGPGNCSTLAEARTTCTPVGGDDTDMACSDVASGYTLNVPNATEYHITGINNNGLVASAGSPAVADNQPAGVLADDAWTNTTGADVDVVYSVVPVSTDGCEGASFTVTITIKPEPVGAADTDMACSDVASGYTLGVTGAATYNITNINSNGLVVSAGSPAVANGQPAGVLADDAWTNTTGADVDVVYTVVPVSADGCLGGPFTVTITIKSEPVGANQNIQVCSGSPGTFDLQNAITNGVNSNFSWVPLSDNPNVTGDESVTPTLGDILNPTLINLTNNPQTAVFRVTPSSDPGACIGSFFDVFVNIDPLPNVAATDNDDPICSGEETDIDVTNPNSVAGATYTWSAPQTAGIDELAGGPVTDTGNAFGTAIQQTLTNATSSSIVVTFTITPVGPAPGFCEGTPVMETVTVQPEPVGANTLLPAVCSNEPFIIDPQTYISNSVPSTFTWTATYDPGLTGGAPNGAGNITGTLVNNTANVLYAVYTVVPASTAGCVGKTFTVTLPVSNLPEVICPSTVVTTTSADDSGDCDTEVDLTHPSPTGYCTPLTMSVAFSNGSPAPVSLPTGGAVTAGGTDAYTFALGQTVVTYTVTDDFGNTDDCNFTVTVTDDENPEITACPGTVNIEGCNTSAITGLLYSTSPQVVTPLQFAAEGGSFTENCSISTISYQDAASGTCPIVVSRTWTITDAANLTVFCVQTINIDDNTAPLVDQAAGDLDATVECDDATGLGAALVLAPTFTDNCDPTAPAVLQSSVSTKGTDPEACDYYSYTITRTWTAKDACNNESLVYTQVITVQDTEEPEADQAAGDLDATVECDDATGLGAALVLAPTFTDNCDPTAPAVLQSSVSTKGTDPEACDYYSYTITRTWTAKDACNNESLVYTQVITVQDTEEPEADQAAGDLDATVECDDATGLGAALVLAPTFTDNCDPTAPAVLQSSVSTKGTDPEACDYYSYTITRTWTAKDACNNESLVYTQVITVQDTEEPEADQAAGDLDATVECDDATGLGAALVLAPTFTDNCDPTAPAVLQSSVSTKGIDPEACDYYSYTITRTWTAKDACNNESLVYTQVITVQDTEEPEADQAAGDLDATVECDDATGLGAALVLAPTFTDNCDPTAPAVLQSSVSTKGTDPEACDYYSYTITRTWTAKDACNNESLVYTQVITVQDTEEPEADQAAGDLDATVECDDATGLGAALVLAPTFTDNCDPTAPAVLQSSVSTKGTDPEACDYYSYTITRTWTAKDACNNESLVYTQVITVQDTEEPEADQAAGDLDATVECDDATGLGAALVLAPTFTDNCDPTAPAVLQSSVSTKGTDPEACDYYSYTITRTWTAKDACNNESLVYTQVITVQDTEEPEADQAAGDLDATVECDDATGLGAALVLAPTFTDNCDPTAPAVLQSSVSTKGTDPEACDYYSYTITRTWTAKDACNNESLVYTQVITVQDTEEPEADQAAGDLDATVECDDATGLGAALVLAPTFTDNCDPTAPAVLQSSVSTKGTDPEACDYYSYTITRTWTAKDACNNESLVYTQVITVQDTEEPEADQAAGDLDATVECDDATGLGAALVLAPTFTDNCDPTAPAVLQSSVSTKGTDPEACDYYSYTITRTWTAKDACNNESLVYTQVITVQDTEEPEADQAAGDLDATVECDDATGLGAALVLAPTFTDNCDPTAPAVLQSSVSTKGTDPEACDYYSYTITRTWTAKDACNNESLVYTQVITVQDTEEPEADQAAGDLDATVECDDATGLGAALVLAPTFTDNCDPTAPAVLQSSVSTKGTDPEACDYYSYTITRTWTAKDACNNESLVYTQVITVQDTEEPEADQAAGDLDATVECDDATGLGAALVLAPTFTDNCDPTAPAVLQSSVSTKGTDPEACDYYSYTITRTWTAKDACNNESLVYTQVITVQDTEEPEVSTTAGSLDATLECDDASGVATALAQAPAASDNCDGTPTLNLVSDVTTPGSCTQEYVRVRTWNFTDDCGNAGADFVQTITVQDETDPVISTVAGSLDATLECSDASGIAAALALQPSATDNCDGTPTLNLVSDVTTPGICTQEYVRVRTWNFTDDCGNAGANFVQTITVQDETDPVVYCIDNTVTLGTNGAYTLTAADVLDLGNTSDACGSYSVSISPATVDCSEKDLEIPVSVTVTDECGNANTCTSLITVDEGSTLPSPWSANDIGSTAMGTSGFSPCTGPGTFTLSAKGFSTNISDVAHFVDQQLCGNSSITVRVTQLTGGGWAGIYFRENLTQGSRMVSLKTQLTTFLRREVRSTPGGVKSLASIPVPQGAHWLRIVRTNNLFVGYYSLNGVNWSFAFSASVNMQSCAYVGMFVESINNTTTTTASFDNVTVQGALPPFGDEDGGQLLTQQPQVNVFPNPTNGLLSIDFGALAGTPAKVQIFNSQGQVVKSLEFDEILEREQIDLSPYTDGVYWVRIFVDGVLIDTKKVIKQEVGYYRD